MSTPPEELSQKNTLVEGQTFEGRFQIISVLGQGGVGVVYKAKQTHMNKLVAIKTLMLSVVSDDAASFERFEQEAQAASSLAHPNIISIFDFGKSATGLAYLVMEYLGGKNLDDVLEAEQRLDLDRFLRIAVQICDALQHAHRKGVVHRDIKPTNIMLVDTEDATDTVKIVDFGLAKLTAVESAKHLTKTGTIVGTPLYMSPEQCRGLELDHRSDIYSVGCVFYTALTGKEPIQGATALDTLYKHTAQPPPPFNEACPGLNLPPRLEQAILKSLEKDPDMRQQSMIELRNDISDAIYYRSFHSGMTTNIVGGGEAIQQAENPARESGLSCTLDMSNSRLPGPPPPAQKIGSVQATQGENIRLRRPVQAEANAADRQTLRGSHHSKDDHLVISKRYLLAVGAAGAAVLAGLAYMFLSKSPNTNGTRSVMLDNQVNQPGRAKIATTRAIPASLAPLTTGAIQNTKLHTAQNPAKNPSSNPMTDLAPHMTPPPGGQPKLHPATPSAKSLTEARGRGTALKSSTKNEQMLAEARNFEKLARDQFKDKLWPLAESNFNRCLQLQTQVYGTNNFHLFPILAHLVGCQYAGRDIPGATKNLQRALQIFHKHEKLVLTEVSRRHDQITIWRPLARTSRLAADSARDKNYLVWSADFYELARNACNLPDQDKEYRGLSAEYCAVLDLCGNHAKSNAIRKELHLSTANIAAPQADSQVAQKATPKKAGKGPRIERHGHMVIETYKEGR